MKGNVVTAAKLFCVSMILSALIVAFGINLAAALSRATPGETTTESAQSPKLDLSAFFKLNAESSNTKMGELKCEVVAVPENLSCWVVGQPPPSTPEAVSGATEEAEPAEEVTPIICPPPESKPGPAQMNAKECIEKVGQMTGEQLRDWLLLTPGWGMAP